MLKLIDIHTHVNFAAYDDDRAAVIDRALAAGVGMINVGTRHETSTSALALARQFSAGVWAAVGLHPIHTAAAFHDEDELGKLVEAKTTSAAEEFNYANYRQLAADPRVVAIGECGLDFFHTTDPVAHEQQRAAFEAQIFLAQESKKPLMLHLRNSRDGRLNAYREALTILAAYPEVVGNAHFFAGDLETAQAFIDRGFTLSFTGVITFTHNYDELIRQLPLEQLMIETDAPYVTPAPHRGQRNEPAYLPATWRRLAALKGLPEDTVAAILLATARRVFRLPIA